MGITRNKPSIPISRSFVELQFIQKKDIPGNFLQPQICSQSLSNKMNFRRFSRNLVRNSEMLYKRTNSENRFSTSFTPNNYYHVQVKCLPTAVLFKNMIDNQYLLYR